MISKNTKMDFYSIASSRHFTDSQINEREKGISEMIRIRLDAKAI